jgi:nucleotide-binding universal stress UspA family protein
MPRFVPTLESGDAIPAQPKKLLVPVDFSPESAAALRYAITLAQQSGGEIDVVHVWDLPSYTGAGMVGSEVTGGEPELATQYVQEQAAKQMDSFLEPFDGTPNVRGILANGDPPRVIAELSVRYDLVVMGRKAPDDVSDIVLGSVASNVVGEARCAVVTVLEEEE